MQKRKIRAGLWCSIGRCFAVLPGLLLALPTSLEAVDFEKDVRPLLAARCFECHGADRQKGGLRLSERTRAFQGGDSGAAIVPNQPADSLLIRLIRGADPDRIMPPKGDRLTPREIALLEKWIADGAEWPQSASAPEEGSAPRHWAYRPLARPGVPEVERVNWVRTPLDRFVLGRLEEEGIEPSAEADRYTLIRRLSYDLLGLPPTPAQVDRFVHDSEPGAYERLVDRLLDSEHFGERWGRHWLDKARYADSDGYEKDRPRPRAWRYRDWVINAVNRDQPFDEFTIDQLAGDLLPNATPDQRLATAFHRQTLTNTEGGTDQEEFRVAAIVDRVNTTSTVWLGLTAACAQCHSHKYDAITQREYYEFFAFFNNADETNTRVPTSQEQWAKYKAEKAVWESEEVALSARFDARAEAVVDGFEAWTEQMRAKLASPASVSFRTLVAEEIQAADRGTTFERLDDGSYRVGGESPEKAKYTLLLDAGDLENVHGFRLETLPDQAFGGHAGRAEDGAFAITEVKLYHYEDGTLDPGSAKPFELGEVRASVVGEGSSEAAAADGNVATAWSPGVVAEGTSQALTLLTAKPYFDGSGGHFAVVIEQHVGKRQTLGRFRLRAVTGDPEIVRLPANLRTALAEDQKPSAPLLTYFTATFDEEGAAVQGELREHAKKKPQPPEMDVRVISERVQGRRTTRILHRGDFLRPKDEVGPGTFSVLQPLEVHPEGDTQLSRLDLARWLVAPENSLTARVAVNHIWKYLFGRALVGTVNDFGVRGEAPTHPELLDWLATEYHRLGWSRKALIRTIVHSATYRQTSRHRPELDDIDPENRFLYRQNRFRVEAEIIRDLALSVSGLLDPKVGGPSVFPPMPPKIAALSYANNFKWKTSEGGDQYRRGMYTFFKRTAPHPTLVTFDCPDANTTCAERQSSNTPLQALTTLNNDVFSEAAQALAARVLLADSGNDRDRLRLLFRLCLVRAPEPFEENELLALLEESRAWYMEHPEDSKTLVALHAPKSAHDFEAAAWTATARIVMNLDEFITRE